MPLLVIDLRKAKRGDKKPGAKYLSREWDSRAGRWRYVYELPKGRRARSARPDASAGSVRPPTPPQTRAIGLDAPPQGKAARAAQQPAAALPESVERFERLKRSQGYESALVVDPKTGKTLLARDGDQSSVSFEDIPVGAFRGAVLTHNHPMGLSFSRPDILFAVAHGLSEIRAVGLKYRYSMRLPATMTDEERHQFTVGVARVDYEVRLEFTIRINAGTMSIDEASGRHNHEVWTRYAQRFGMTYTRERWEDMPDNVRLGVRAY